MDPSTTLFTFMLQTHPSVHSVRLCGSWDNFQKLYRMERDIRRYRGQWRGCYSFKDMICDGDQPGLRTRDGGLKMGQTYYYYYELNGSTEVHDPTMPSTNTCPFLPGQSVNTLHVPIQRSERKRSASLTSLRKGDYMTMNPNDKYTTPRAAPPVPGPIARVPTAPANSLKHQRSARSLSPSERSERSWSAKRLFRIRPKERGRDRSTSGSTAASTSETWSPPEVSDDQSSIMSEGSSRSRDISPEALHLFLSNDMPTPFTSHENRPTVTIPEDIVEEGEDDDNFATSASSESAPFTTILSPPPFQRAHSSNSLASSSAAIPRASAETAKADRPQTPPKDVRASHFSVSSSEDEVYTPSTPQHEADGVSFFDDSTDSEDEDDEPEGFTPGSEAEEPVFRQTKPLLSTYSLPHSSDGDRLKTADRSIASIGPPALITTDIPTGNANLLAGPTTESAFDDLVSELRWMVDYYRTKPV